MTLRNSVSAAHVGAKGFGHDYGSVSLLILLEYGDKGAANRQPGSVEGVQRLGLVTLCGAITNLGATSLEVAKI